MSTPGAVYLDDARAQFRKYKLMADKAMAQVSDEALFLTLDDEANSIAIIAKHMAGNMRSRWRDFLTTDGEKPDRHRDTEFEMEEGFTRNDLLAYWEEGWHYVFEAIDPLTEDDLLRTITIREEPHTVINALNRQLTHYAYHVGQIVLLCKHFAGDQWESLSIPRGQSEAFLKAMRQKHQS